MSTTYQAILRDDRLEWRSEAPRSLAPGVAIRVQVTVLDESSAPKPSQGQQMAAALEELAQSQALIGVDAGKWAQDARAERPLPGRDIDATC